MPKKNSIEEILEFSVTDPAHPDHRIGLMDFCTYLLLCADFMDGFLEYAERHRGEDKTNNILATICESLTDFRERREPFNEFVKGFMADMVKLPEIQTLLAESQAILLQKPKHKNTTKS